MISADRDADGLDRDEEHADVEPEQHAGDGQPDGNRRRLGQRLVTATITNSTAEAIHIRQNDSTTPEAWVDLPSTPPIDHISGGERASPARHRGRPAGRVTLRLAAWRRSSDRVPGHAEREVAEVVTCAR